MIKDTLYTEKADGELRWKIYTKDVLILSHKKYFSKNAAIKAGKKWAKENGYKINIPRWET